MFQCNTIARLSVSAFCVAEDLISPEEDRQPSIALGHALIRAVQIIILACSDQPVARHSAGGRGKWSGARGTLVYWIPSVVWFFHEVQPPLLCEVSCLLKKGYFWNHE